MSEFERLKAQADGILARERAPLEKACADIRNCLPGLGLVGSELKDGTVRAESGEMVLRQARKVEEAVERIEAWITAQYRDGG